MAEDKSPDPWQAEVAPGVVANPGDYWLSKRRRDCPDSHTEDEDEAESLENHSWFYDRIK